jgi:hypothetical protein
MSNGGFVSDVSYIAANDITVAALNTNFDISGNPLNISLLDFDKNVFLDVSGILSKTVYDPSFTTYDAIAALDVSLSTFRSMFAIESDSDTLTDLSHPALLDNVNFVVYDDRIINFVPKMGENSSVISGSEELNDSLGLAVDQHVKDDFVRHLANILFNTPYATELFINQAELVMSVSDALDVAWGLCKADLHKVSNTNTEAHMTLDIAGNYRYLTDASSNAYYGVKNICGEIFKQLVSRDPERFINTNTLKVNVDGIDGAGLQQFYLPLIANDIINIRITINANQSQDTFGLTNATRNTSFISNGSGYILKPKVYLVQMKLV